MRGFLQGARLGYAFKRGPQGLGYYLDEAQVGKEFIQAREKSFLEASRPGGHSTSSYHPPAAPQLQQEEMDLDLEDVQLEEKGVPVTVLGSLRRS